MSIQIAIEQFQSKTGYKLNQYLLRVNEFFTKDFQPIYDWYGCGPDKPNVTPFKNLYTLISESVVVLTIYYQNKQFFKTYYFWDLLEKLEDINTKLTTTSNLSRILRSTRAKGSFNGKLESTYTTRKFETLEDIQRNVVGSNNADNTWWDLALRNDLKEEDYSTEGGDVVTVSSLYNTNTFLESVVDNLDGLKAYGRDINKKLTLIDDDLETLSNEDTVIQSLETFLETKSQTVPEFKNIGYDETLVVGQSRGIVNFSILQRQLMNIFSTDDSFKDFKITDLKFDRDAVILQFEISTILGETLVKTLTI